MSLVPLYDRILVGRPIVDKATTRSGLLIPESASRQTLIQAKVLAKGTGKIHRKTGLPIPNHSSIRVGDMVVFPDFAGYKLKEDLSEELKITKEKDETPMEMRIIREEEVLAVVKDA